MDSKVQRLRVNHIFRKEQQISTTIYTYTIDITIDDAHVLYFWLMDERGINNFFHVSSFVEILQFLLQKRTEIIRTGFKNVVNVEKVIIDGKEHLLLPLNVRNKGNR